MAKPDLKQEAMAVPWEVAVMMLAEGSVPDGSGSEVGSLLDRRMRRTCQEETAISTSRRRL